ncbi:MAG: LPS export ABC transporter permease LptG [Bdellovibrionales bacterium]|nr:LPS export ABC transporter permease LptG [Bdellovibrionales bacterium]
MSIIDKYIGKLFLLYFTSGLLVFVTLFVTIDAMSFASHHSAAGPVLLVRYYLYYLPSITYQMMPVACLLGTVSTLTQLSRSNELTALYSLGVGLVRVCAPLLAWVLVIALISFVLSDQVLPRTVRKKNYTEYVEIKNRPSLYSTVNTNKIWYRSDNVLFNIKTLDAETSVAQGLTLYYFDAAWDLVQLITAEKVKIEGTKWELSTGAVTLFPETTSFPLTKSFSQKTVLMNEDMADIKATASSASVMSLKSLRKFIVHNKEAGLDTLKYEVDYYAKFGFASAAFAMSLFGIPFSLRRQRAGGSQIMSIGACLVLSFAYWVLYSSGLTLGQHGSLPPMLAAWGPSVLMISFGVFLLKRLRQ